MNTTSPCIHKWVYQSSHYAKDPNSAYIRVDIYFCEKCCQQKEVRREESSRDIPIWWMH